MRNLVAALAAVLSCASAITFGGAAQAELARYAGNDGLAAGCMESGYSAKAERIGVLRSTDDGVTWVSLGNACFHWPSTPKTPVDPSPIVINGRIVLYFMDFDTLHELYRAESEDGLEFGAPSLAFQDTATMTDPYVLNTGAGYRLYLLHDSTSPCSGPDGCVLTAFDTNGMFFQAPSEAVPLSTVSTPQGSFSYLVPPPGALSLPGGGVRLFSPARRRFPEWALASIP